MSNWLYAQIVPTERWRSAMTIPRELVLSEINNDFILKSVPVKELESLRETEIKPTITTVSGNLLINMEGVPVMRSEMIFDFQANESTHEFGIQLSNEKGEKVRIGYSRDESKIFVDRTEAGVSSFLDEFAALHTVSYVAGESLHFHVFVDEASVEVFVDGGKAVLTDIVFPGLPYNKIELFSARGSVEVSFARIWGLASIW